MTRIRVTFVLFVVLLLLVVYSVSSFSIGEDHSEQTRKDVLKFGQCMSKCRSSNSVVISCIKVYTYIYPPHID